MTARQEELVGLCEGLTSPEVSVEEKRERLSTIQRSYLEPDSTGGYVSLTAGGGGIHLPGMEWSLFRKGYTLMAWVRPTWSSLSSSSTSSSSLSSLSSAHTHAHAHTHNSEDSSVLFRLGHGGLLGVVAPITRVRGSNNNDKNRNQVTFRLTVESFLPFHNNPVVSSPPNPFPLSTPPFTLTLSTEKYSLLTISHTHPYLKRPQVFVSVNHELQAHYDLCYPFSSQNLTTATTTTTMEPHDSGGGGVYLLNKNVCFENLAMNCAGLAMCRESLWKELSDQVLINLVVETGLTSSSQLWTSGVFVPPVPPQRDGRRMGSPLSVHSASVKLQNYFVKHLLLAYDFRDCTSGQSRQYSHSHQYSHSQQQHQRLRIPSIARPNATIGCVSQHVGWVTAASLIAKTQSQSSLSASSRQRGGSDEALGSLVLDGRYSQHVAPTIPTPLNPLLYSSGLLTQLWMPFHLAFYPMKEEMYYQQRNNTSAYGPLQPELWKRRQILQRHLLFDNGSYAKDLLLTLSQCLEVSWYCREEALQTGVLHLVASYVAALLSVDTNVTNTNISKETKRNVEDGLMRLVDACCGDNPVRRTSDLAMTCVFGVGLNLRLAFLLSNGTNEMDITDETEDIQNENDNNNNNENADSNDRSNKVGGRLLQHTVDLYKGAGNVLAEHLRIQTLLDQIRHCYGPVPLSVPVPVPLSERTKARSVADLTCLQGPLTDLLTLLLESQPDVSACVQTLAGGGLGHAATRIVLSALVAARQSGLAKELAVSDFPTVVGPVLLSRAIDCSSSSSFSSLSLSSSSSSSSSSKSKLPLDHSNWGTALELLVWVTSISGSEGERSAQKFGVLLQESANAGLLEGCIDMDVVGKLFHRKKKFRQPQPKSPSARRRRHRRKSSDSWAYDSSLYLPFSSSSSSSSSSYPEEGTLETQQDKECKDDVKRVRVLMPLLRGIVSALLGTCTTKGSSSTDISNNNNNNNNNSSSSNEKEIVPVLMELIDGIGCALVRWTDGSQNHNHTNNGLPETPQGSDHNNNNYNINNNNNNNNNVRTSFFASIHNRTSPYPYTYRDPEALIQRKNLEWTPHLVAVADQLRSYQKEHDTDWIDVNVVVDDVRALSGGEEGELLMDISSCLDGVLDSLATLLWSSLQSGARSTVPLLQALNGSGNGNGEWALPVITRALEGCTSLSWSPALCEGVTRVCAYLEERAGGDLPETLLSILADVLRLGREESGWYQTNNSTIPTPSDMGDSQPNLLDLPTTTLSTNLSTTATATATATTATLTEPDVKGILRQKLTRFVDEAMENETLLLNNNQYNQSMIRNHNPPFLQVLQPTLRIVLRCLSKTDSLTPHTNTTIDDDNNHNNTKKEEPPPPSSSSSSSSSSLLQHLCVEVDKTVTAALVGLSFVNARDMGLGCLSSLRSSRQVHSRLGDTSAVSSVEILMKRIIHELRERHSIERRRNILTNHPHNHHHNNKLNSDEEPLLQTGDVTTDSLDTPLDTTDTSLSLDNHNNSHNNSSNDCTDNKEDLHSSMGWSKYAGLGHVLDQCCDEEDTNGLDNMETVLELLAPFLDSWEQTRDDEEADMVGLFDDVMDDKDSVAMTSPNNSNNNNTNTTNNHHDDNNDEIDKASEMAVYFVELSSAEKVRLEESQKAFPALDAACDASAAELGWSQWLSFHSNDDEDNNNKSHFKEWERCAGLRGGKDVYSHLGTTPVAPKFPRHIPHHLDQSTIVEKDQATNTTLTTTTETEFNLGGQVQIVDITKQAVGPFRRDSDDEAEAEATGTDTIPTDGSLGFPTSTSTSHSHNHSEDDDATKSNPKSNTNTTTNNSNNNNNNSNSNNNNNNNNKAPNHTTTPVDGSLPTTTVLTPFSHPPNTTLPQEISISSASSRVDMHWDDIVHIRSEGSRRGVLLMTKTQLIIEYFNEYYDGEIMAMEEAQARRKDADGQTSSLSEEDNHPVVIDASRRPNSVRFLLSEITHFYLRRFRLRDSAFELFFLPSGGSSCTHASHSLFLDFGPGANGRSRRDGAAVAILRYAPRGAVRQHPEKSHRFLHEQLQKATLAWAQGSLTNFDYLLQLNTLAGRSFNDLCQYPVMPWVLSNYASETVPDLHDPDNYRDLTKPMGAINAKRLSEFIERFETFSDPTIPPFMYGSHYSTSAGVVLHFLVRLHPFAGLHRQLQGGHFDVADRLFCSVQRTWESCTGNSASEVKELTPEWYCNPEFLRNTNKFKLGSNQEGQVIDDVILPKWADNNPEKFVEVLRCAMESDVCTAMLPDWIDLIFGYKQQGPEAIRAHNVFFYLTYYGSVDISSIPDEALRVATELQIAHFGQCPMQLFWRPHVKKLSPRSLRRRDCLSNHLNLWDIPISNANAHTNVNNSNTTTHRHRSVPVLFRDSPINNWVHLPPPPPGPHEDMVCVRVIAGRCVAVDSQGIFHFFRWQWRPDYEDDIFDDYHRNRDDSGSKQQADDEKTMESESASKESEIHEYEDNKNNSHKHQNQHSNHQHHQNQPALEKGCFISTRESHAFRTVPRMPMSHNAAVAIGMQASLLSGSSLLLVLSDGDGAGGLSLQFVDPALGTVTNETLLPHVHGARISSIAMDSTGSRPQGEVAILGSHDGTATLWRFIFRNSVPLRPRLRMVTYQRQPIVAVAISCHNGACLAVTQNHVSIYHLGNGTLMRRFGRPPDKLFANTRAVCFSRQGHVITVCQRQHQLHHHKQIHSQTQSSSSPSSSSSSSLPTPSQTLYSIELFTMDGVHCGSYAMGDLPTRLVPFAEGRAVMVCCGRGVTVHSISALNPLRLLDEWRITDEEPSKLRRNVPSVCDVDFLPGNRSMGPPAGSRPVVCVAGCTSGVLRIHALPGITRWAEEQHILSVSSVVGNALSKPANTIKNAVGSVKGIGSRFIGFGKELGKEVGGAIASGNVTASTVAGSVTSTVAAGGAFVGGLFRKIQ